MDDDSAHKRAVDSHTADNKSQATACVDLSSDSRHTFKGGSWNFRGNFGKSSTWKTMIALFSLPLRHFSLN
jgi:hypothetical protein